MDNYNNHFKINKTEIFIFIVVSIIVLSTFYFYLDLYRDRIPPDLKEDLNKIVKTNNHNQTNLINEDNISEENKSAKNKVVYGGGGGGSGGGGSGTGGSEETVTNPSENIPNDAYIVPCGTYFMENGICTGVCPDGKCINEGRNCYCKII